MTYERDCICPYCDSPRILRTPGRRTVTCTNCGKGGHITRFRDHGPTPVYSSFPRIEDGQWQPRTGTKRLWSTGAGRR